MKQTKQIADAAAPASADPAAPSAAPAPMPSSAAAQPVVRDQLVFIQFAGVLTREQITALNQTLRNAGWKAQSQSGERTPDAAGLNEVRFCGCRPVCKRV